MRRDHIEQNRTNLTCPIAQLLRHEHESDVAEVTKVKDKVD